ncbi:hypothetical protein Ddye_006143 [Dipteronia dyeriana]|uniref:MULE transposase domain-containing protein n=1 Tax=Dipteronia dyeriana TaxID=168575 RepID=A0AAD9XHG6_9ROSI|nr:hypothetical protein Ddye_006143 [Dipteronia dyeriana]
MEHHAKKDEHAYPIAFGVGDGETENSWTWFLERLREVIGEVGGMIFIFDRHASITKALSIVYPNVPHCICFFHLKQNLKPRLKGRKEVLDVYYKETYCSTSRQFDVEMDEIKKIHQGTYATLMSIEPERWSRSQCPGRRYQMMTMNIKKVQKTNFNSLYHEYYSSSWMQTAYAPATNPVPHPSVWEVPNEVGSVIVLLPNSKRQAGRPKERRIPSAGEVRR